MKTELSKAKRENNRLKENKEAIEKSDVLLWRKFFDSNIIIRKKNRQRDRTETVSNIMYVVFGLASTIGSECVGRIIKLSFDNAISFLALTYVCEERFAIILNHSRSNWNKAAQRALKTCNGESCNIVLFYGQ